MNWHGLRVYGLRLDLPAPHRSVFPGHHVRGLLGRALFDTVCLYAGQRDDRACADCPLRSRCAYPQVFKPTEPDRLAPYWLHQWERRGANLCCTWHVLEQVRPHLDAWLFGLQRHWLRNYSDSLRVWDAATGAPLVDNGVLRMDELQPLVLPVLPADGCRLQALTPIISKHQGDPLYGALRTRAQRLIQHYGDGARLLIEDRPWESVVESELAVDIALERRVLRGHVYRLRMQRITEPARELLAWGQWLHAGGHTSVGCGAYALESPSG
jgi:hypothetical protein